jgi:hypothetical protein
MTTIPTAALMAVGSVKMVEMPHHLFGEGGFQLPSFAKIGESAFWIAVTGFALVSSIETLLSAKAVDSLDPYKRASNLDKDLVSMGAGSSIAAAIGGLPMISEIVRSSANVNNGAKTQWSNFFHGSFLLIYLLVGVFIIEMIPLAALAAMLVFTGFRLASPKEFKHMFKVGLMELEIFIVTLISVLATDLIIGILIGILFKYVLILYKGTKLNELFKSHLEIGHVGTKKILHLKGSQIFSNYLSLKKKMDSGVDKYDELILDFKEVNFVDHTVMEHLEDYARQAKMKGKDVHIENVGGLNPVSDHPLAARDKKASVNIKSIGVEVRTLKLLAFAQKNDFVYSTIERDQIKWDFYTITTRKEVLSIKNILQKKLGDITYSFADITVKKGAQTSADIDTITGIRISGIQGLPKFSMTEESIIDRIADKFIGEDINFDEYPKFSKNCVLKGPEEKEVRKFFSKNVIEFFETNPDCFMVSNGRDLFLRKGFNLLTEAEMAEIQSLAEDLTKIV